MNLSPALQAKLCEYVETYQGRLVEIIGDLVRIPSENKPPVGSERECQEYSAHLLRAAGWEAELYDLTKIPALQKHPLYWPGRNYENRPNLGARREGKGGGRSLVLSGHIDTVPCGTQPWTRDPLGGQVEGNRLYGRGSNDMKSGIGIQLFIAEALQEMGLSLAGDLVIESVIDEEFGGVNGTLAGRVKGYNGDAAVITESSFLKVCSGHRGGRTVQITLKGSGGILTQGKFPSGVVDQLTCFLNAVKDFAAQRRKTAPPHKLFSASQDPVPVSILKIFTSPWGTDEPLTPPEICKIEFYWQLMPGEGQEEVERQFFGWFDSLGSANPELFPYKPEVSFPIRWLPGSAISNDEPLVTELSACAAKVLGSAPPIAGNEGPCDMYIFHQLGTPAVIWGPRGGNTHAADEYLEIDSTFAAAKSLLLFVCDWCGVAD